MNRLLKRIKVRGIAMVAYERETNINYNDGDDTATVYTCNAALMRKMDALCEQYDEACKYRSDENSSSYCVPKSWIKIRPPRAMSDEQREAAAERMRALAAKRKNQTL